MVDRGCGVAALWIAGCVLNPEFDPVESSTGSTEMGSTGSSGATDTMDPTGSTGMPIDPDTPLGDPCPPLGPPAGETVNAGPGDDLESLIAGLSSGTTLLLEPGTYPVPDGLWLSTPEITIRSSTGNPADVVLDGDASPVAIFSPRAANIAIAEITIHRAAEHAIHITGSSDAPSPGFVGYRLVMTDHGGTAFKVNPSSSEQPADDGLLACSRISVSDEARQQFGDACTDIGGFIGIASFGWHLRDNQVEGMWCPAGFAGGAIRFIENSADPIVERNVVRDSVNGIVFGVYEDATPRREYPGERCDGGFYDHYGGLIVNNVVTATGTGIAASEYGMDAGIGLWQVCDATVVHNTVVSAIGAFSSIEYRFSRTQATVVNNLVTDEILDRNDAGVPVAGNLQQVELTNFVDPLGGDVHLVAGSLAIDAAVNLGDDAVSHDIDGDPRGEPADVGADEFTP